MVDSIEVWKNISGYAGMYQVSTLGSIKSFARTKPRILKPGTGSHGYSFVILCINNVKNNHLIHRLVAEAFIPNLENKEFVNHKNGIKTDNRVENLEWCTREENERHAWATGLKKTTETQRKARSKSIVDMSTGIFYSSIRDASDSLDLDYKMLQNQLSKGTNNKSNLKFC